MTLEEVSRYDKDQVSKQYGSAVVIGASMAGLLAARVFTDVFEEVTLVEQDPLPDEPVPRAGVPQGRHFNGLLEAARITLEDLFPGYGEDLFSSGGLALDISREAEVYQEGGFLADSPSRIPMYTASRPLIEHVTRRRVATLDEVRLRSNCHFTEYLLDDKQAAVTGVTVRSQAGEEEDVPAELVIDATGRTSRTPVWLEDHGFPSPTIDEVGIDVSYSSTLIERPSDDRRFILAVPSAPRTRGGVALPVEENRWLVTMMGMHGDHPPTDPDGFTEFAASLPISEISRLLNNYGWLSDDIDHYPFPSNLRRRYENLEQFPDGLVVIGDAVTSFNPIYGQGMSVAGLEAIQLHHCLADGGLGNLPRRYFDRIEDLVDIAWMMALGGDFGYSQTQGPKPRGTDVFNRYISRLIRTAHSDGEVADAFYRDGDITFDFGGVDHAASDFEVEDDSAHSFWLLRQGVEIRP